MTQDVENRRIANAATETEEHGEIEVTSEMTEAGMWQYSSRWLGLCDADDDVAREMLSAAYRAMYRLRPRCRGEDL
jgi:hypothetical protein